MEQPYGWRDLGQVNLVTALEWDTRKGEGSDGIRFYFGSGFGF